MNTFLFQIEDKKRSWIVHHDRPKLCNDSELQIWIQRKRSPSEETESEEEEDTVS